MTPRLWSRARAAQPPVLALETVQRRLAIFLNALHDRPLQIVAAPLPPVPRGWRRVVHTLGAAARALPFAQTPRRPPHGWALASIDGDVLRLPPQLDASDGPDAALGRYRAIALALGERARRESAAHAPFVPAGRAGVGRAHAQARLSRDLYHLAESAAAEQEVARAVRGLGAIVRAERAAALAARPDPTRFTPAERDVEALVRAVLAQDPAAVVAPPGGPPPGGDPRASRAWAEATATAIAARYGSRYRYRGVAPVAGWGAAPTVAAPPAGLAAVADHATDALQHRTTLPIGGSRAREADAGEEEDGAGLSAAEGVEGPSVDDPRAPAQDTAAQAHDAGAPAPPVDGVIDPTRPNVRALDGAVAHPFSPPVASAGSLPPGIPYPEWDATINRYVPGRVTVREAVAATGADGWADAVARAQAPLVRRVRARFEPMRARRVRLPAQRRGDEFDLSACVQALVDVRAGRAPGDRLYVDVRPARRPIATLLLTDVSGSTDLAVDATRQVIDVEREAVLLATAALDAIGDPYAVLAFSSRGASDVRLQTVKRFSDRDGDVVRRRLAGLVPNGNTRLGGALRHATTVLGRQPAGHRLLLVLSDGQPNDTDGYQGRSAIEDARRAVLEARAAGVIPFCLTVDREEPEAAAQVFGAGAYTVLRDPAHLPHVLVDVVAHLLGR